MVAVVKGQHYVQHNQVRVKFSKFRHNLLQIAGTVHSVSPAFYLLFHNSCQVGVVLNYKYFIHSLYLGFFIAFSIFYFEFYCNEKGGRFYCLPNSRIFNILYNGFAHLLRCFVHRLRLWLFALVFAVFVCKYKFQYYRGNYGCYYHDYYNRCKQVFVH